MLKTGKSYKGLKRNKNSDLSTGIILFSVKIVCKELKVFKVNCGLEFAFAHEKKYVTFHER